MTTSASEERSDSVARDERALSFSTTGFAVRQLFPTPLIVAPINEAASLNAVLRPTILARAEAAQGVVRSNRGGWQSATGFETWCGEPGRDLLALGRDLASGLTGIQGPDGVGAHRPEWKMNAWANVNAAGDGNAAHHHPAAFWSGVYWVDAGEPEAAPDGGDASSSGGEFEVIDPRGVLPGFYAPDLRVTLAGCLSAGGSDFVTPRTGVMILFPSWLVHSVRPYAGGRPRISVAFNLSV